MRGGGHCSVYVKRPKVGGTLENCNKAPCQQFVAWFGASHRTTDQPASPMFFGAIRLLDVCSTFFWDESPQLSVLSACKPKGAHRTGCPLVLKCLQLGNRRDNFGPIKRIDQARESPNVDSSSRASSARSGDASLVLRLNLQPKPAGVRRFWPGLANASSGQGSLPNERRKK